MDETPDGPRLHDWDTHQPHVFGSPERSKQASEAANSRWKRERERAQELEANATRNATSMQDACATHADGNAPSDPPYLPSRPTDRPPDSSALRLTPPAEPSPGVATFDCVGTGPATWTATEADLARWREAYPAVDVLGELRRMGEWHRANPRRRKTARGMPAFVVRWLDSEQDRGGSEPTNGTRQRHPVDPSDTLPRSDSKVPVENLTWAHDKQARFQALVMSGTPAAEARQLAHEEFGSVAPSMRTEGGRA